MNAEFSKDLNISYESAPEITVLGVGNIVLRDEGFGVRVVEYLQNKYVFPAEVQVLDGGTLGMELMHFIPGTKRLLIIDAIKSDDGPGHRYVLRGAEVKGHFQTKLSAHEIGIQDLLAALQVTGKEIGEVVVIGASPYILEAGLALSAQLMELVPEVAEMAVQELARWGISLQEKGES